ncbi:MAG: SDR family oxidoreductase [Candidatus Nanopelagicales bacterium]
MADVSGKSILIIGATGGLGRALSARLKEAGAVLTMVGRDDARLAALAPLGRTVVADVRRADGVAAAVNAAVAERGGIDGVIFSAGVVAFGQATDTPDDVLIELFTTNTLAPIRTLREAAPHLRESAAQGRDPFMVTISAVVAEQPMAGMAAYSASKAALMAYDHAAAREIRRAGIRLLDARPPHTETGLADHPIYGEAPRLPEGLVATDVAERIVTAIIAGERDLPSSAFATS